MKIKNLVGFAVATLLLLLVPLVAMRFTREVNWTAFDFVVAGTLLFGSGVAFELVSSRVRVRAYQAAAALAVAAGLALVWINLAVGVIGTERDRANLMYAGVLAIAVVGSLAVRFRPAGMARALVAMALAQLAVGAIATLARLDATVPLDVAFAVVWTTAALLFRKADAQLAPSRP